MTSRPAPPGGRGAALLRTLADQKVVISNAASLFGTTAVTSVLGAAFWWVAAREFSQPAVGLAGAAVSAMMLLGFLATLGLNTLLLGELRKRGGEAPKLIVTSTAGSAVAGLLLGLGFAFMAPLFSADLEPLSDDALNALLFGVGVALTGASQVVDQAAIGMLRGGLQLWRNVIFAGSKLAVLAAAGVWLAIEGGMEIYLCWTIGTLLSLLYLIGYSVNTEREASHLVPRPSTMRGLGKASMEHHFLNTAIRAPGWILPVIVIGVVSATANAHFYVAYMVAGFVYVLPIALSNVLYAVGTESDQALAEKLRFTLAASVVSCAAATLVVVVGGSTLLSVFGDAYAEGGSQTLVILTLAAFPVAVKSHYVAVRRIKNEVRPAMKLVWAGAVLELVTAAAGASIGGVDGLSIAWALTLLIESLFMWPTVQRAAWPRQAGSSASGSRKPGDS